MAVQLPQTLLNEVRSRLVNLLHPKDIYVFGSYAKGTANADSDLDLFIVMPKGTETKRSMVVDARRAIAGTIYAHGLAFDLLIKSTESFERYKAYPGTLQHEVATYGISIID